MVWSGVLLLMLHFVSDFEKVLSHKVHFHLESTWSPCGVYRESTATCGGVSLTAKPAEQSFRLLKFEPCTYVHVTVDLYMSQFVHISSFILVLSLWTSSNRLCAPLRYTSKSLCLICIFLYLSASVHSFSRVNFLCLFEILIGNRPCHLCLPWS